VFSSLLASVDDERGRERLLAFARLASDELRSLRSDSIEADVVAAVVALKGTSGSIAVKAVARALMEADGSAVLSPRAVGSILRRLGFSPRKRQGNYVLVPEEMKHLAVLVRRYGVMSPESTSQVDIGDIGDVGQDDLS